MAKAQRRQLHQAPKNLTFFADDASGTIRFVREIRESADPKPAILIDFSETRNFTAAAAVYLYSEIEQLQCEYGPSIVRTSLKGLTAYLRVILRESGLIQLMHGDQVPTGEILPIVSGEDDERIGEIVGYLMDHAISENHLGIPSTDHAEKLVGDAINEAMLNVKYHAYPDQERKRWWLSSAILDHQLHIALCDRGVGIPVTLPRKEWYEFVRGQVPVNDDAWMIQAAMRYTRSAESRTPRRGLGTRDIQQFVLDQKSGHLTVISGSGHYRLSGEFGQEEVTRLKANVGGTVIQWTVPLSPDGSRHDIRKN